MEQVKVLPVREQVAALLRKAILAGEYDPGELLTLDRAAEMVGVSRTPVREAFQILAMEGLIDLRPNRGAVIKELSDEFIEDHFNVRSLLEQEAAARTAAREDIPESLTMAYINGETAHKMESLAGFNKSNEAFHLAIWEACGSEKLKMLLGQLWNGLSIDSEMTSSEYMDRAQKEHLAIYEAIREHDAEAARQHMAEHLDHSRRAALEHLRQRRLSKRAQVK